MASSVSLRQLRYLEAVARYRHFGRAAAACAVSQPALSMQIKELEAALGAVLVERGARQVRLTEFGELALPRVRQILRSIDELTDFARVAGRQISNRLRVGMIPTIAPYLLPALIRHAAEEQPDVEIHVREAMTAKLIEEIRDGRLDTAIVALPVSEASLTELALFTETFVLVRPADMAGEPVPPGSLWGAMRLLLLEEGHCFRGQALSFCNMHASAPREGLDANSFSTLVQMVAAGMGVTLLPEIAISLETRSAAVSIARFEDPQPSRTVGMIWRKSSPLAARFMQLSELVSRAADTVREPDGAAPALEGLQQPQGAAS